MNSFDFSALLVVEQNSTRKNHCIVRLTATYQLYLKVEFLFIHISFVKDWGWGGGVVGGGL